jgi:hypothetical protein
MPRRKKYEVDPDEAEAVPEASLKEADEETKETVAEAKASEPVEPRKYRKRKSKEGKPVSVPVELVEQAADGALSLSSTAYVYVRGPPELRFDPKARQTFITVLGRWAEESGFELPLWVQVLIAGGTCIVPAIAAAEAERKLGSIAYRNGDRRPAYAVPLPFVPPEQSRRPDDQRSSGGDPAASEVRPAAVDSGGGS